MNYEFSPPRWMSLEFKPIGVLTGKLPIGDNTNKDGIIWEIKNKKGYYNSIFGGKKRDKKGLEIKIKLVVFIIG